MRNQTLVGKKVHIPVLVILDMNTVTVLGDPCPLPTAGSGKMLFVLTLEEASPEEIWMVG